MNLDEIHLIFELRDLFREFKDFEEGVSFVLAPFLSGIAIAREQTVILLLPITITVATLYPLLLAPLTSVALFRRTGLESLASAAIATWPPPGDSRYRCCSATGLGKVCPESAPLGEAGATKT